MDFTTCNGKNGTIDGNASGEQLCAFPTAVLRSSQTIDDSCQEVLELVSWITNGVLGLLIFLGNALVCSVFLRSARLRRIYMNKFLLNLALCDLSMAIIVVPGYGMFCTGCTYPLSKLCWLFEGGKDVCFLTSVFSVLAITYDRYLAVFQPLSYRRKITKRKAYFLTIASWLLSILLASVRNSWQHDRSAQDSETLNVAYSNILLLTCVFCPIVVTSVINTKIILAIKSQRRVWRPRSKISATRGAISDLKATLSSSKGTMSCVLIVLVFTVCWIPRACYFLVRLFNGDDSVTLLLSKLSVSFLLFQSSVNPVIYSFYRADFRIAAKNLISCRQRSR